MKKIKTGKKETITNAPYDTQEMCFMDKNFVQVDLKDLNFAETRFIKCCFYGCNLNFAKIQNALLTKCSFYNCTFNTTNFTGTFFQQCNFINCNGKHIEANHTTWENCSWKKTQLSDSSFKKALFYACKWIKVDLSKGNFQNSKWKKLKLRQIIANGIDCSEVTFQQVKARKMISPYAVFHNNIFNRLYLSNSTLTYADFYECQVKKLKIKNTQLDGSQNIIPMETNSKKTLLSIIILILCFLTASLIRYIIFQ